MIRAAHTSAPARLKENIVYNVVGQSLVLALNLVAVRLIFVRLGGDVFGIIFFILTLSPLMVSALDLGLSSTVTREVSQYHERDNSYVERLLRTAAIVYCSGYVVASATLVLLAPILMSRWVHLAHLDPGVATELLRIIGVGALTALVRGFYGAVIRGIQRMRYSNSIDVAVALLQQGGATILLLSGANAHAVVVWMSVCFVLGTLAYVIVVGTLLGWQVVVPGWSGDVIERTKRFSVRVFAVSVLSVASLQLDKVIVSKLLPIVTFGFYSFAGSLAYRATYVSVAISLATLPALSSLLADDKHVEVARQYRKLQDLQCIIAMPVLALVMYAEMPLFDYVFDKAAALVMIAPLLLLCLGFFVQIAVSTLQSLLVASGTPGLVAKSSLLGLLLAAAVGLATAPAIGMPGAALSYTTYSVTMASYMVLRGTRPFLNMSPLRWYGHAGRLLLAGILTYGLPLVIAVKFQVPAVAFGALYCTASAAFLTLTYVWLLGPELKQSLLEVWRQTFLKVWGSGA